MISDEYKKVTIENVGGGVAKELFEKELNNVLKNIDDINTEAKEVRRIMLSVSITPGEDRNVANVSVKCSSKLAGLKAHNSSIHLPKMGPKREAYIHDVEQLNMNLNQNVSPIERNKDV